LLQSQDIEAQWEDITENSDGTLQRMLKYFWVSRRGSVLGKDLYRKLKVYGQSVGAAQLTDELSVFSSYYAAIRSNDRSKIAEWLRLEGCENIASNDEYLKRFVFSAQALNLFKIAQHYPLVYSMAKAYERTPKADSDAKIFLKLLSNLEKYHFVNNQVCQRIGNEVEKPYADFAQKFFSTQDFRGCASDFSTMLMTKRAPEEEFVSRFVELDYSSMSLAETCYIFDRFNNHQLNASEWAPIFDPDPLVTKKSYNTEHLLSRNPEMPVSAEDKEAVDNIGNLFIISRHTNSHLQNRPPLEKIPLLRERGISLRYVAKFIEDFEAGDGLWGHQQIRNRAEAMARKGFREVWNLVQI
jgi:hypothetical protein